MENFLAKLSLYDFLTTILLGGCLYVPLIALDVIPCPCDWCNCCGGCCHPGCCHPGCCHPGCVLIVGICYLTGLICHKFGEVLDWSNCINKKKLSVCPFLMAVRSLVCRNQLSIIRRAKKRVGVSLGSNANLMSGYLSTYYSAMCDNKLGNIPKIEAHSAFAKDLCLILVILDIILLIAKSLEGSWCLVLLVFFLSILAFSVLCCIRYNSEFKIHTLIWEYKKYNQTKVTDSTRQCRSVKLNCRVNNINHANSSE